MTEHSPRRRRRHKPRGFWSLLRSQSGIMDLGSVTAGVVIVGILSVGTAAMVFGVIPWAQNNGSQQMLSSISSAQTVAVNKGGKFLDDSGLMAGGFIQKVTGIATGTNGQGNCFVTVAKSDSGKIYFNTNKATDPQELKSTTKLPCVTGSQLQKLVDASGATLTITPETYYAWGWGNNADGQAGTGDAVTAAYKSPTAMPLTGLPAPVVLSAVSAGTNHACAVTPASKIYCWGDGTYYKLGQPDQVDRPSAALPVVDSLLAGKDISLISSGGNHNCIVADAQAYCWGHNGYGQLGNGTTTSSGRPVLVPAFAGKTVTSVSAGHASSCAAVNNEAWCWGENSAGRIGDGTTTDSLVPVKVAGLLVGKKVTEVSVGRNHACAVASAAVYCWGTNGDGQLGNGNMVTSLVPVKVTGIPSGKTIQGLSAGANHNCVTADGIAYCWGANSAGELGIGTNVDSSVAMPVNGLLRGKVVTTVSASLNDPTVSAGHTCAIAVDVQYCWGDNVAGELGNGSNTDYTAPVKAGTTNRKMIAIAAGGSSTVSIGVPIIP